MKRIVSVSLGSAARNSNAVIHFGGEEFELRREGYNGDLEAFAARLRELDGTVDAIGLGGCSFYLYGAGGRKYPLRSIVKLAQLVQKTPLLDGAAVKDTLERDVVRRLPEFGLDVRGKRVLMVCGLERLGMAEALEQAGAQVRYGDAMFAIGLPFYIKRLKVLHGAMAVAAPAISRLPFRALYPSGDAQEAQDHKHRRAFDWAEVIAGDYLYIRKHLPDDLTNKVVLTNTVTAADTQQLQSRGCKALITATPLIQGRSYGTNVLEALLAASSGIRGRPLTQEEYAQAYANSGLSPRVTFF